MYVMYVHRTSESDGVTDFWQSGIRFRLLDMYLSIETSAVPIVQRPLNKKDSRWDRKKGRKLEIETGK